MVTETEIWKVVPGFENTEVSNLGHVRNQHGERKLTYHKTKGYARVTLYHNGKSHCFTVHRLVALLFVPNPDPEHNNVVMHLDDNPRNNRWDNLAWGTTQRNNTEGRRLRLFMKSREKSSMPTMLKNIRKISGISEYEGTICIMYDSINDAYVVSSKDMAMPLFSVPVDDFVKEDGEIAYDEAWNFIKKKIMAS